MAGSRTEKYTVVYRNSKRCEFHNIGQYIIATSVIGGTTFCAFFHTGIHTEESIKRRGSIKLHSIYSNMNVDGHQPLFRAPILPLCPGTAMRTAATLLTLLACARLSKSFIHNHCRKAVKSVL